MIDENKNIQTSLAENVTNEEEKSCQTKKNQMQRKYRLLSIILVAIIVVTGSLLITKVTTTKSEPIEVTVDNWSKYFVISKEIVDNSIILDNAALYSMHINYTIRLQDYYMEYLDTKKTSKISFSLTYQECFGLFETDFENLVYIEPDGFSVVSTRTADVVVEYPQSLDNKSGLIYVGDILSGGQENDTGLGCVGKEFCVSAVSGTLYLEADR